MAERAATTIELRLLLTNQSRGSICTSVKTVCRFKLFALLYVALAAVKAQGCNRDAMNPRQL